MSSGWHTPQDPDTSLGPVIAFAGGGTGGHIFPALAVVEAIKQRKPAAKILFFATTRPIDRRLIDPTPCELITQSLVPFSSKPWCWPTFFWHYQNARKLCQRILQAKQPTVLVGTGGLGSIPPVKEALRAGIKVALLNPDALPGRANRHLSKLVDVVFAQWDETRQHLPHSVKMELTGCPTRKAFANPSPDQAIAKLGLDSRRKTLVITGASQGARSLNEAVLANLDLLKRFDGWQVVHQTGELDYERVKQAYAKSDIKAVVLPFIDQMADTLAAADLVVARSGASTLAELTTLGKPAILLPYPYHRDNHQQVNAQCLVQRGAAILVVDSVSASTTGPQLSVALERMLGNDSERIAMADAAKRVSLSDAAQVIADKVIALADASAPTE